MERINKIQEFLKENPKDSFLQHALALEYVKLNDDSKAKGIFEKLLLENENYVGSYYHLAKLYERMQLIEKAVETYKKGMQIAKLAKDNHSFNELQAACEDLEDL